MSEAQDKRFLVRLDPALWADLEVWAREDRRSINNLIAVLLERAVEQKRREERRSVADEGYTEGNRSAELKAA